MRGTCSLMHPCQHRACHVCTFSFPPAPRQLRTRHYTGHVCGGHVCGGHVCGGHVCTTIFFIALLSPPARASHVCRTISERSNGPNGRCWATPGDIG
eukprot:4659924-Pyramimonas_sp.AAC.4